MRNHEIEAWALSVVDRLHKNLPLEDARVELKRDWPDYTKAARRIAAHANAAHGAPVLWLIGADESRGVTGADHKKFSNWYNQVKSYFNELAPDVQDLNVPVGDNTVVALCFQTDRAPFVVNNPAGGSPEREVPWREATGTRSATRAQLLRILSPIQLLPEVEVRDAWLTSRLGDVDGRPTCTWRLQATLYVVPGGNKSLVVPVHRCTGRFCVAGWETREGLSNFKFKLREGAVRATATEQQLIMEMPGEVVVSARTRLESPTRRVPSDANVRVEFKPVRADAPVVIPIELVWSDPPSGSDGHWVLRQTPPMAIR